MLVDRLPVRSAETFAKIIVGVLQEPVVRHYHNAFGRIVAGAARYRSFSLTVSLSFQNHRKRRRYPFLTHYR